MHYFQSAFVAHVHAEPLLAHVLLQEIAAFIADKISVGAPRVAILGAFNFDDFCAHAGKAARQIRTGQKMAVVNDSEALQGEWLQRTCLHGAVLWLSYSARVYRN